MRRFPVCPTGLSLLQGASNKILSLEGIVALTKLTRLCPNCMKVFYTVGGAFANECPHCGYSFVKKRAYKRTKKSVSCTFVYRGTSYTATTRNVSKSGVCIEYQYIGEHLPKDAVLKFSSRSLNIYTPARLVWTKELSTRKAVAGLKFLKAGSTETTEKG